MGQAHLPRLIRLDDFDWDGKPENGADPKL